MMWLRWTLPRLRIDQVMTTCLKYCIPLAAAMFFGAEEFRIGIYLVFASLVLELSSQICFAYIRAREYSFIYVMISFAKLLIQVSVCTYLVVVEKAGVNGVLTGNLITVFIGWLALSGYTLYHCGFRFHLRKFLPILKYCYPFLFSTIVAIASSHAGKFILNEVVSIAALGLFGLALKFSMIIEELIGSPFNNSYGAFRYTIMKNANAGDIQADIVRYLLIVSVFAGLGISLFVGDLLRVMSDPEFWDAAAIVPILILASMMKLIVSPMQTGIFYAKKTKFIFYLDSVSAIVSVTASLVLIYYYGITGACLALLITDTVRLLLTNYFSQRFFVVNYEKGKLLLILLIGIGLFLCSYLLAGMHPWVAFAIKCLLAGLFVILMFVTPALRKNEAAYVKTFLATKILRRRLASG